MRPTTFFSFILFILFFCCPFSVALAQDLDTLPPALQQELSLKQEAIKQRLREIEDSKALKPELLEQAKLEEKTARLQVQNLGLEKQSLERDLNEKTAGLETLQKQIEEVKKQPVAQGQEEDAQNRLRTLENAKTQVANYKQQLSEQLAQVTTRLHEALVDQRVAEEWLKGLQPIYLRFQQQSLDNQAQSEHERYQQKAEQLRAELAQLPDASNSLDLWQKRVLEARLLDVEERAMIALRNAKLAQGEELTKQFNTLLETHNHPQVSEQSHQEAVDLAEDMTQIADILRQKIPLLEQRLGTIKKLGIASDLSAQIQKLNQQEQDIIANLLEIRKDQLNRANNLLQGAQSTAKVFEDILLAREEAALYQRRNLPLTPEGWHDLLMEVVAVPGQFWHQLRGVLQVALNDLVQVSPFKWVLIGAVVGFLLGGLTWAKHAIQQRLAYLRASQSNGGGESGMYDETFLYNSFSIVLRLIDRNLGGLILTLILLLILWFIQPAKSTIILVLSITVLWLAVKLPINLAWLLLAAPNVPTQKADHDLYKQLRSILILFGIMATITLLLHVFRFTPAVLELNDTLFMLFLLLAVGPSFHLRKLALKRLEIGLQNTRWLWLFRFLSLLLPLSILSVSVLGVLGFINLGWYLALILSWFILVLTAWLILRGLLSDLVLFLKNYALTHSQHYGLLWTQDIIPLLHRLSQIALALTAALTFLSLSGWDSGDSMRKIADYPLFTLAKSDITVGNLLLSAFALYLVIWFASWMKRITYRWIYSGINDLGVRNSLSTFTQYTMLVIGGVVTLRILGLDLTTFTVFAGALGVGLGFGLQNIANNFVSGLLLLAERPLRTGDLVNIGGTYEGEVKEIGVRSLTIKTWDYQEVIVPNSELISHPFTNWTHSDNILRTVLFIGVSYNSDLKQVFQVLHDIIEAHKPKILDDPEPGVLLHEFADSAIVFRLYYYNNLKEYSKLDLQSEMLFSVWEQFKAADIEIPYPQRDVHVRNCS
jgi:potassium efflux system protein